MEGPGCQVHTGDPEADSDKKSEHGKGFTIYGVMRTGAKG